MAEEEQTLDLTNIGNGEESNIEGNVEENNEEEERLAAEAAAKAEEERVAAELAVAEAAKAEEERVAAEEAKAEAERVATEEAAKAEAEAGRVVSEESSQTEDEGVLTHRRVTLIKHQGAQIYDRDKKVILENVSSEGLFQINNAPTEGRKINLMRKFINNSMVGK